MAHSLPHDPLLIENNYILTTSQHSAEAYNFVQKIMGKNDVLVDGQKVIGLMLDHNVGVSHVKEICSVYLGELHLSS